MSDDIMPALPSKTEALEFTDKFRDALDNLCDAGEDAAKFLRQSQKVDYWNAAEYDSWADWYEVEFEDQIRFLKNLKLSMDTRTDIVESLANGGLSNRQIATTIGVNEKTVRNDLRRIDLSGADTSASNEVDAAGQSVEKVGLIEDNELTLQIDDEPSQSVIEEPQVSEEDDKETDEERKARLDAWMNTIDFGSMVIQTEQLTPSHVMCNTSTQIIETDSAQETPEYFVPRQPKPRGLEVINPTLPHAKPKAYDDLPSDFLAPPAKLEKPQDSNKDHTKHCKTCACNLLP